MKEPSIQEYILAQLKQPVLVRTKDGRQTIATDPRDGHELTAKEVIVMKIMQNAMEGDINSAQFIMQMEAAEQIIKKKK